MTNNTHTVGSHSDDRGGEADYPCYCEVKKEIIPTAHSSEQWRDGSLIPIVRRIVKAVEYTGTDDREDVQTILKQLIARERQKAVEELTSNVDRFEVIDQTGRAYVKGSIYKTPVKVELSLQDDGRTLKAFVEPATQSNKGEAELIQLDSKHAKKP